MLRFFYYFYWEVWDMKRFFAILLVLCLIGGLLPASALADGFILVHPETLEPVVLELKGK